jgi:hypothetical protein
MVSQDMSMSQDMSQAQVERRATKGATENRIAKLMVVRRRNKETGELYVDRFYLTVPYEDGQELLRKGHILFKLETRNNKLILTPIPTET